MAQPVQYSPAAFDAAIAEVDAAIQRLDERMHDRLQRIQHELSGWQGGAATTFRGPYQRQLDAVHQRAVAELEATRAHLIFARDTIEQENARRAWLRERSLA